MFPAAEHMDENQDKTDCQVTVTTQLSQMLWHCTLHPLVPLHFINFPEIHIDGHMIISHLGILLNTASIVLTACSAQELLFSLVV